MARDADQPGSGDGAVDLVRCDRCGAYVGGDHVCTSSPAGERTGSPAFFPPNRDAEILGVPVSASTTTGDAAELDDFDESGLRRCDWCERPASFEQEVDSACGQYFRQDHACTLHRRWLEHFEYQRDADGHAYGQVRRTEPRSTSRAQDTEVAPSWASPESTADAETNRQSAGWSNGTGTRGGAVASLTTGEAPNIEAARDALQAMRAEADQTVTRVDQLSASLQSADLDAQTLGEVAEVLEAADVMKAAADKALAGMQSRHAVMEEAVNSTAHAAKTDWYRH